MKPTKATDTSVRCIQRADRDGPTVGDRFAPSIQHDHRSFTERCQKRRDTYRGWMQQGIHVGSLIQFPDERQHGIDKEVGSRIHGDVFLTF